MFAKTALKTILILATISAIGLNAAHAGSKPDGASAANAEDIRVAFSGKSWRWKEGGAYHAKDGKMIAILWEGVVGVGRWSVSSDGTLCHNATWYWNKTSPRQRKVKDCWKHVVDQKGRTWQHDRVHGWYKFPKFQISSGDKYSRRVNRLKKKIGL